MFTFLNIKRNKNAIEFILFYLVLKNYEKLILTYTISCIINYKIKRE